MSRTSNSGLFDLHDRVAVVTGAGHGLGPYLAEVLAQAGARLVLSSPPGDELELLAARLRASGIAVMTISCDLSDAAQVAELSAKVVARFGRIDIAVNHIGQSHPDDAGDGGVVPEKLASALFDQMMRVHLDGVWSCCQEFGAQMLQQDSGGSVINVSPLLGISAIRHGPVAYHAARGAVINLTKLLASSWTERKVRINALAPGFFAAELTAPTQPRTEHGAAADGLRSSPELAGPLLFLASSASSHVTGHTLVVDGGFSSTIGNFGWPPQIYETPASSLRSETPQRVG